MFSSRINWDLRPNPLSVLRENKRRTQTRILDLTESNPTCTGLTYPDQEILDSLADPRGLHYDPQPLGLMTAREAVSRYYFERGVEVSSERILLTASTSEAYTYLFKLLADPGDEILTPRPSYPLFEFLAAMESLQVRQYPLLYDGCWRIDFEALTSAVTPRTRAIVVVNPNNPTGSFLKLDELRRLEALAAERGIAILSDEVFADYAFGADPSRASNLTSVSKALTFSMSGLSKVCGLPQLKLGWIVASGPGHDAAMERLEIIADTYLSVGSPVQVALPRLLAAGASVRHQILHRTRSNLTHLHDTIGANSACRVLHVEGGWNAIVQVPRTRSEEEWAITLLDQSNVLVQPGFFFEFDAEAFLVLSLLPAIDVFQEGVRAVAAIG